MASAYQRQACLKAATLIVALLVIVAQSVAAQVVRGGVPGAEASVYRPASADAKYAQLYLPDEFAKLDLKARRLTMNAWINASPEKAGPAILSLIDAGLRDGDTNVRTDSIAVLERVEQMAQSARLLKQPVVTDPRGYRPLVETMWRLIDHDDPETRRRGYGVLTILETPPSATLETVVLERLPREKEGKVRPAMVTALTQLATFGSLAARQALLRAFDDPSADVQGRAILAMSLLKLPDGMPRLAAIVQSKSAAYLRANAAKTLESYGAPASSYLPTIRTQLGAETDGSVKTALEHFVRTFEAPR